MTSFRSITSLKFELGNLVYATFSETWRGQHCCGGWKDAHECCGGRDARMMIRQRRHLPLGAVF